MQHRNQKMMIQDIRNKQFPYLGAFDVVKFIIRKTLLILTQSGLKKHVCIDTKTYRVQQTISSKFVLRRGEERKERKEEEDAVQGWLQQLLSEIGYSLKQRQNYTNKKQVFINKNKFYMFEVPLA